MKKKDVPNKQHMLLLEKALKIVQNLHYKQEPQNFETLAAVLRKINFFQQKLEHPANLHDFVELAKYELEYEVLPYGTVITREDEYTEKFCIVLKGEVQKLKQKHNEALPDGSRTNLSPKLSSENVFHRGFGKKKNFTIINTSLSPDQKSPSSGREFKPRLGIIPHSQTLILPDSPSFRLRRGQTRNRLDTMDDLTSAEGQLPFSIPSIQTLSLSPVKVETEPRKLFTLPPKSIIINRAETLDTQGDIGHEVVRTEGPELKLSIPIKKRGTVRGSTMLAKGSLKEWKNLLEFIRSENLNLDDRLFCSDGEIRVQKVNVYGKGDYFGETFYKSHQRKENCIIAVSSEEVHLLTLKRESYKTILAELTQEFQEKIKAFTESLPSFDKDVLETVAYYFSRRKYKKGETIYCQNDAVQNLYLLKGGDARLLKEIEGLMQRAITQPSWNPLLTAPKRQDKIDLPIISVAPNQFFGEEFVLGKEFREYTALVHSNEAFVYFLEKTVYNEIRVEFEGFFEGLVEQTQKRFKWRQQRANDLLVQQQNLALAKMVLEPIANEIPKIPQNIVSRRTSLSPIKDGYTVRSTGWTMSLDTERQINKNNMVKTEGKIELKIDVGPAGKNLELYKNKYSRKVLEQNPENFPKIKKKLEDASGNDDSGSCIKEFNVRKELENSHVYKSKRVTAASLLSLTQKKASETLRSNGGSFANLMGHQLSERNASPDEVKNMGMFTPRDFPHSPPTSSLLRNKLKLKKLLKRRDPLTDFRGFIHRNEKEREKNKEENYALPQPSNIISPIETRNLTAASSLGLSPRLCVQTPKKKGLIGIKVAP